MRGKLEFKQEFENEQYPYNRTENRKSSGRAGYQVTNNQGQPDEAEKDHWLIYPPMELLKCIVSLPVHLFTVFHDT